MGDPVKFVKNFQQIAHFQHALKAVSL